MHALIQNCMWSFQKKKKILCHFSFHFTDVLPCFHFSNLHVAFSIILQNDLSILNDFWQCVITKCFMLRNMLVERLCHVTWFALHQTNNVPIVMNKILNETLQFYISLLGINCSVIWQSIFGSTVVCILCVIINIFEIPNSECFIHFCIESSKIIQVTKMQKRKREIVWMVCS